MMEMNNAQTRKLKSLGHDLSPVVMIGQHGLKESTEEEIVKALKFHQLIKIKVSVGDRDLKKQLINQIVEQNDALLVQAIGNIALLYKRNPKKPNLLSS